MKITAIALLIVAVAIGLLAFAVSPQCPMIKEMRQLKGNDIQTGKGITKFFYDAQSRVSRVENSNGVTSVYEYKPEVIYRRTTDPRRYGQFTDTFLLDAKGMVRLHRMAHDAPARAVNTREYDADGLLVREYSTVNGVKNLTTFVNRDGNVVSTAQRFADKDGTKGFYAYYPQGANTIGNDNMGMGFEGHNTKNLLQSHLQVWQPGDTNRTYQRYRFDAQGRVSMRVTYYNGRLGDSTAFIYY